MLKPFKTEAIKPYFDYPLNTSILEQTVEFTAQAILGTGTGLFPAGTYGVCFAISPHAFTDLQITNIVPASSVVPNTLCNTRFITVFA